MARKRTPKVIGVRKKSVKRMEKSEEWIPEYVPRIKTEKEKVYDVIQDSCISGYRFIDQDTGTLFINLEDIEEKGKDIYVVRFRCKPHELRHSYFGSIAEEVCAKLRSGIHFIHEAKQEWGLPYEECAWIIQVGELDNDIPIWRRIFMEAKKTESDRPSPKKCAHERWEDFLQSHYNRSLLSVAQELGYSEQNLDILGCDPSNKDSKKAIYKKYKSLFDSFLNDEWNKSLVDGRNVLDYFKDLIASWIGEDLLVKALNEYGFTATVANADSDRVIKTHRTEVTGEPDIKIEYEGNTRYLELMVALSPVEKYGQFDLRLSKAKNQYNRKTLFLLHGLADNKFVLIDFLRDNVTVSCNYPNPRYGNKPSSIVKFEDNNIRMQDVVLLWETLRDIMQNTKPEPQHCLKMVDFMTGKVEILGQQDDSDESSDNTSDDSEASFSEDTESSDVDTEGDERESAQEQEQEEEVVVEAEDPEQPQPEEDHQDVESDETTTPPETNEDEVAEGEEPTPEADDESSFIEEDDNGGSIEYTSEQWAALNDVF